MYVYLHDYALLILGMQYVYLLNTIEKCLHSDITFWHLRIFSRFMLTDKFLQQFR